MAWVQLPVPCEHQALFHDLAQNFFSWSQVILHKCALIRTLFITSRRLFSIPGYLFLFHHWTFVLWTLAALLSTKTQLPLNNLKSWSQIALLMPKLDMLWKHSRGPMAGLTSFLILKDCCPLLPNFLCLETDIIYFPSFFPVGAGKKGRVRFQAGG